MQVQQQIAGVIGTVGTAGGFAGFMTVAEPYMKLILFVVTVAAGITTYLVNRKRLRDGKKD